MLADAGDLDRLVALATDPARHHRMLDATGGDAAALAEIAAALALVSTSRSPDLLAALRLAWHRDQLADRNTHIPAQLPAVWAALGQPVRAEALARSITNRACRRRPWPAWPGRRQRGGHDRARELADRAEQVARSITDPDDQARALAGVAGRWPAAGDHDRAEQVARSITDPDEQARALASVAGAVAAAGDHDRAEQVARSITRPVRAGWALASVARAAAAAGDYDRARALAADAEQVARSITDPYDAGAGPWPGVAGAVAAAGRSRPRRAGRPVHHQPGRAGAALAGVAVAAAEAGDHDRARALAADAEQVARSITDPGCRRRPWPASRWRWPRARRSRPRRAGRPVHHRPGRAGAGPGRRGGGGGRGGRSRPARELAADAEQVARSITDPCGRPRPWPAWPGRRPAPGDHDRAEQVARSITDPDAQALALAGVAGGGGRRGGRSRPCPGAGRRRRAGRPVHHRSGRAGAGAGPGRRGHGGGHGGRP